jgi:hypothetical protein
MSKNIPKKKKLNPEKQRALNEIIKYAGESPSVSLGHLRDEREHLQEQVNAGGTDAVAKLTEFNVEVDKLLNSYEPYSGRFKQELGEGPAAAAGDNNPTTDEDRVEVLMEYAPNAPPKRSSFPYRGLISINEVGVKNIDYVSTPIPGDTMQQHSSFGHTLLTKCAGLYNSVSLENVMRLLAAGANPSVKIKKSTLPNTPMGIAIEAGNPPVVMMLLLYGVGINETFEFQFKENAITNTNIDYAAQLVHKSENHRRIYYMFEAIESDDTNIQYGYKQTWRKSYKKRVNVKKLAPGLKKSNEQTRWEAEEKKRQNNVNTIIANYHKDQNYFKAEMKKRQGESRQRLQRRLRERNIILKVADTEFDAADINLGVVQFLDADELIGKLQNDNATTEDPEVIEVTKEDWKTALTLQENHLLGLQVEKLLEKKDKYKANKEIELHKKRVEAKNRLMVRLAVRRKEAAAKAAEAAAEAAAKAAVQGGGGGGSEGGGRRRRRKRRTKKRTKKRRKTKKRKSRKSKRRRRKSRR